MILSEGCTTLRVIASRLLDKKYFKALVLGQSKGGRVKLRFLLAYAFRTNHIFVGYLGERNLTSWLHTIQLGEPNCREPEAQPH
jgi:hypothetical protein